MRGRVSAADWCDVGLSILRDEGMPALTVERLCAALSRTKGSFYHHFRDLDGFLDALLSRWETTLTEAPIEAADSEPDLTRRAALLDATVAALDHQLDLSIRAWALWDARFWAAVERVDTRRIAYLVGLHRAGGAPNPERLGELEYIAFLGTQQLRAFSAPGRAARLASDARF